ncbi:MAG: LysO family transporter [Candidatus Delongbacteria bacterium]|nr:LysO family transporter [Candidatus Delongbacteria bacterium]
MNTVLICLILGSLLGYIIREKKNFLKHLDKITFFSVLALLFLLGFSVGKDPVIIRNLHNLGLQALILSVAAILGSAIVSFIVYKLFFKDIKADEK